MAYDKVASMAGAEMTNVIAFKDSIPPGEPNPDMVETLEGLLADAKSGVLRGIAYATVREGDITGTGWDGSDGSKHWLSSAIMMMHHRYSASLLEGDQ